MTCECCGRETCPKVDGRALYVPITADLDCERARSARLERERDEALRLRDHYLARVEAQSQDRARLALERDAALARAAKLATDALTVDAELARVEGVARGLGEALERAATGLRDIVHMKATDTPRTVTMLAEDAERALAAWRELEGV